jgi:endogenous inhibitor of DNA gyrase (YacG/DUF329 family)
MKRKNPTPKCPSCRKEIDASKDVHFLPFCSKRCQMVDLGKWFKEEYTIPVSATLEDAEETIQESDND